MKKLTILCTIIALCAGYTVSADNDKQDGKKTPPGLQKKDGVPPGQAKKRGQAEEATPSASPVVANTPAAPAALATPTAPAPATAVAPTPAVAKPATLAQQKTAIETHARQINQATKSNPAMHKAALQHISKDAGVSLEHLREQDKNFPEASDTGLLLGNVIAKKAGVKFSDVMQARQKGKGWDEIAKAHKVDVGLLVQKSSELAKALHSTGAR